MSNNNTEKHQVEAGLSSSFSLVKTFHNNTIDATTSKNPLLRMFFDSDLNSPIESTVEKMYADSYYQTMREILPSWKPMQSLAKGVGYAIAYAQCKVLDLSKLNYHYFNNRISREKYYNELSRRIVTGTVTFVNKGWPLFGKGIKGGITTVLVTAGMPIDDAKQAADKTWVAMTLAKTYISSKINGTKLKERAQALISTGLQTASTGLKKIVDVVRDPLKSTKQAVKSTKQFISNIAEQISETVETFSEKVDRTVTTVRDSVVRGTRSIWERIKSFV